MKRLEQLAAGGIVALALAAGATTVLAQDQTMPSPAGSLPAKVEGASAGTKPAAETGGNPLVDETKSVESYVFTALVFLVLLVVLRFTAWKPILYGLKERERSIREGLDAAAKARADAEKTTRDLEAKIAEAQRAGAMALAQVKLDAQKMAETIRVQAEAESGALKERATRDIEAAKEQAIAEINAHAAAIGTAVARKILHREVRADDQQRLVDESLAELGTTKGIGSE